MDDPEANPKGELEPVASEWGGGGARHPAKARESGACADAEASPRCGGIADGHRWPVQYQDIVRSRICRAQGERGYLDVILQYCIPSKREWSCCRGAAVVQYKVGSATVLCVIRWLWPLED